MPYNKSKNEETVAKSLRMPIALAEKIDQLAAKNDRDFTKQVIFIIKEYIRIKESQ